MTYSKPVKFNLILAEMKPFALEQMGKYSYKRKKSKDILRKIISPKVFPDLSLATFISNDR